jgi:hypothetical protein
MYKRTIGRKKIKKVNLTMKKQASNFQFLPRPFSRLVTVCGCLAAAMTFVVNNSLAAGPFLTYRANAYGTYANVGSTVIAGTTAYVTLAGGCGTPQVGLTLSGTVGSVSIPPLTSTTGAINTSATSALNSATGTADVNNISLLGGLITATEVKAVSTTSQDNTGFHTSGAGSSLANLIMAGGLPINVVPAPNTTFQILGGAGKVVLNEQIVSGTASTSQLTVNMIHVTITAANVLNIAVGTQIIVSHALSGLTQYNGPAYLDGTAYGTQVTGALVKSSPTALVSVLCQGNTLITKTQLSVNVVVPITLYPVLNTGTIQDTAQGSVAAAESSSQTTASIQTVNVLNNVIKADAINAQANASTKNGAALKFSTSGSFVNLSVSGHPDITASVAANTQVSLAGIGTLYLKRVIPATNNIQIRMIEVVLAAGNILGLPTGTDIIVGSASASLHSPTHP